jgi:hypothetical protein
MHNNVNTAQIFGNQGKSMWAMSPRLLQFGVQNSARLETIHDCNRRTDGQINGQIITIARPYDRPKNGCVGGKKKMGSTPNSKPYSFVKNANEAFSYKQKHKDTITN